MIAQVSLAPLNQTTLIERFKDANTRSQLEALLRPKNQNKNPRWDGVQYRGSEIFQNVKLIVIWEAFVNVFTMDRRFHIYEITWWYLKWN